MSATKRDVTVTLASRLFCTQGASRAGYRPSCLTKTILKAGYDLSLHYLTYIADLRTARGASVMIQ